MDSTDGFDRTPNECRRWFAAAGAALSGRWRRFTAAAPATECRRGGCRRQARAGAVRPCRCPLPRPAPAAPWPASAAMACRCRGGWRGGQPGCIKATAVMASNVGRLAGAAKWPYGRQALWQPAPGRATICRSARCRRRPAPLCWRSGFRAAVLQAADQAAAPRNAGQVQPWAPVARPRWLQPRPAGAGSRRVGGSSASRFRQRPGARAAARMLLRQAAAPVAPAILCGPTLRALALVVPAGLAA